MGACGVLRRGLFAAVAMAVVSLLTPSLFGDDRGPEYPKRIAKEPRYRSAFQQYALLVLGPDEGLRVWLVADGDNLYVDVNGDGDLTQPGEWFKAFLSSQDDFIPLRRTWKIRKLGATERYSDIEVSLQFANPKWRPSADAPTAAEMTRFMEAYAAIPNANFAHVHLEADGRMWLTTAMFTTSKASAPVFRMDTKSYELGVIETLVPHVLSRRPGLETLSVGVGAAGSGGTQPGCFSWIDNRPFGKFSRPVVEIEFPAEGGGYLPVRRYTLGSC